MDGTQNNGEAQRQPDDNEPNPKRQTELEVTYEANVVAGKPPYQNVEIQTRGELRWVMEKRRWSGTFETHEGYDRANLSGANLSGANLSKTNLVRVNFSGANLLRVNLSNAKLDKANLSSANLSGADLSNVNLSGANLSNANLYQANLSSAYLEGTNLSSANVYQARLSSANLEGADLSGADIRGSQMDVATSLTDVMLSVSTRLADVVWNNTSLTRIAWEELPRLGDEADARQHKDKDGKCKYGATRLVEYQTAARSCRQLAVALREQGLNEEADRFAYRAQLMQRIVLRRQAFLRRKDRRVGLGYRLRKLTAYTGSGLLDLIAGYGYRPGRSLLAYILIILTFAGLYLLNGQFAAPHLRWDEALVLSVSSFHGRGFFTTDIHLGDTLARLAAGEAIVGLLIEITFIATFTQRFFAR